MILFDANKCVSCNSCIRACPTPEANKAVQTEDGRTVYNIDPDKCILSLIHISEPTRPY